MLSKELKAVKIPTRTFYWLTQIWSPNNWVVQRSFQGQSETIPTVLSTTATAITTPRSNPSQVCITICNLKNKTLNYVIIYKMLRLYFWWKKKLHAQPPQDGHFGELSITFIELGHGHGMLCFFLV